MTQPIPGAARAPRRRAVTTAALLLAAAGITAPPSASAQAVVHAVIFYSPTCPHCHKVITEDLPPLVNKYGARFMIIGVDVTTPQGSSLYQATVEHFGLVEPRLGVPTLVVGSEVMVGEVEIPERLPGLIERGLASGGVDWPPVDALRQALAAQGMLGDKPAADSAATEAPPPAAAADTSASPAAPPESPAESPAEPPTTDTAAGATAPGAAETLGEMTQEMEGGPWAKFRRDPLANGIAVVVLLGMLVALATSIASVGTGRRRAVLEVPTWAFPLLAAVGMGIASYLALVEITGASAVCGPVGNCNAVQQSPWAMLFGVPVGFLGQVGYLAIFGAWVLGVLGPPRWKPSAWLALWVMTLVGTGFSAYLTVLEPFVIGATCMWCLGSAVILTVLLLGASARFPHDIPETPTAPPL
jgi:uncharacterized membrane protein/thiol-disulfide isomerase/thioredoxin